MSVILVIIKNENENENENITFNNEGDVNLVKRTYVISDNRVFLEGVVAELNINQFFLKLSNQDLPILIVPNRTVFFEESLKFLLETLNSDPLYGLAIPRTLKFGSEPLYRANENEKSPEDTKTFVANLSDENVNGLFTKIPIIIKPFVIQEFYELEQDFLKNILNLSIEANKRGFLTCIVNRSYLETSDLYIQQKVTKGNQKIVDRIKLFRNDNDDLAYENVIREHFIEKAEASILFDIRSLQPRFNGTAIHILSLINPLISASLKNNYKPTFWVGKEAMNYHQITDSEYFSSDLDNHCYDVAVRLSQPWSFNDFVDFSLHSSLNIYLFLDAIAYDCNYLRMPHLESLWNNVIKYSDGLIYNSLYTQERFFKRFPDSKDTLNRVIYCSLDVNDYKKLEGGPLNENYILVVGNAYYHKDLEGTIRLLSGSFPNYTFKVLGHCKANFHNVQTLNSGDIDKNTVERLYANAKMLVFPSYYEGFGLPVVTAMSYSVPVLTRESLLNDEIVSKVNSTSIVETYNSDLELIQLTKKLFTSKTNAACSKSDKKPISWNVSANKVIEFINEIYSNKDYKRCKERIGIANLHRSLNSEKIHGQELFNNDFVAKE